MAVKPRGSRYGWLSGVRDARCCQAHHEARAHARPDAAAFRVRWGLPSLLSVAQNHSCRFYGSIASVSNLFFF